MSARRVKVPMLIALAAAGAAVGSSRATDEAKSLAAPARSDARASVEVVAAPAPAAPQAPASPAVGGMRAFRDPKTGALREAEHDEVRALDAAGAARVANRRAGPTVLGAEQPALTQVEGADGVTFLLDDSYMTATVATIGPDGRVSLHEVAGTAAAEAKVKQGRPTARPQEERE